MQLAQVLLDCVALALERLPDPCEETRKQSLPASARTSFRHKSSYDSGAGGLRRDVRTKAHITVQVVHTSATFGLQEIVELRARRPGRCWTL